MAKSKDKKDKASGKPRGAGKKKVAARKKSKWDIPYWQPILVALLAAILYAPSIEYGFVLDDDLVCAKHQYVQSGDIGAIFSSSYYEQFTGAKDGLYRPMSISAFALEKKLVGKSEAKDGHPSLFHRFNLIWYAISVALLYFFLQYLFPKEHWWLPLGICLLFLAHPIHTEVVANIKSRDEIFVFVGMLGTLSTLLLYWDTGKRYWLALSLLAYLFACLSKENGLPIIALLPLTLYFFRPKATWRDILSTTAAYLAPVVLYFVLRAAHTGPNSDAPGVIDNILYSPSISWVERWATVIGMVGHYLYLLVFPKDLSYDYSAYQIPIMGFGHWRVLVSLVAIAGLSYLAYHWAAKRNPLGWGIWQMGIMFVLVSNIFFPIGVNMAERLMFAPSLGFCFMLGYAGYHFLYQKNPLWYYVSLGLVLLLYVSSTFLRLPVWQSNDTLHISGIKTAPNSARTNSFYGKRLMDDALASTDPSEKQRLGKEAILYFDKAISIVPSFRDAHQNKGICLLDALEQPDAALHSFDAALALDPDYTYGLAGKGVAYLRKGEAIKGLPYLEQAHEIAPDNTIIQQNYGAMLLAVRDIYRKQGDIPTAIEYDKRYKRLYGEPVD